MAHDTVVLALEHARLKIEWAKQHINAVEALVNQVAKDNANVISIEDDREPGRSQVRIGPEKVLDVRLPLHTGDAIHALNSSWDYLWSGLARAANPALAAKVTAPSHETRQNIQADINKAKASETSIYLTFPQAESFVLDGVKPYNPVSGGSAIWQIGKLDNISKHRLLLLIPYIIAFDGMLMLEGGDGSIVSFDRASVQTQGPPLQISLASPVKFHHKPKAAISVVFAENDLLAAQPVLEALVQFTDATTKLCDLFEKTFF